MDSINRIAQYEKIAVQKEVMPAASAQKAEKVYMITGEGGSWGWIIWEKIYEWNLTSTFIDIDFNINDYSLIVYQYWATNSNYRSWSFSPQYLPSWEIEINWTITFNSDRTQMAWDSSTQRLVLIWY